MMKSIKNIPWECGKGWWPMIEKVASAIDSFNVANPENPIEVSQIKQKFGGLRIYCYNAPEDIRQLIDLAVNASWHTCEKCGSTETVTTNDSGYMQTLCPECRKQIRPRIICKREQLKNMELNKLLTERLIECGTPFYIGLICQPSEEQMEALKEGSGNPEAEMWQINSSAGLAVNFWRAYELCHPNSTVEFEWKRQTPLKRGFPANIDVVVNEKDSITFIESKFLEPYYSGNEVPREAYMDESKYSSITKDSPKSWVELFMKAKEFKYYNVTQLCRHLLAISKDMWEHPEYYESKKVKLCSIVWEMPVGFDDIFVDEVQEEFASRRLIIREEASKCDALLNDFISKHLDFPNLQFKATKYNDVLGLIERSPYYSQIKEQYYL